MKSSEDVLRCSFCSKPQNVVRKLIAGPSVFICDECVAVCVDVIADDARFEARRTDPEAARWREKAAMLKTKSGVCALCGQSAVPEEMLPVESRGSLCGECADAVEDALARGTPFADRPDE
jgi:hypothetical protein